MDSKPPTSQDTPLGKVKIKTEPGLPATNRLQSFRLPRDLTLAGTAKSAKPLNKVYTPNINVQRNKKKEDASAAKNDGAQKKGGRGRGRGGSERGRGRGAKNNSNLIQSAGVFSEGISGGTRPRSYGGGGGGYSYGDSESKVTLERSKLNLNYDFDKVEEEKKLKLLLRDDFIDDGEEYNMDNAPVVLPLQEQVGLFKDETEIKKDLKATIDEDDDSDDEKGKVDQKPIILENGEAVMPPRKSSTKSTKTDTKDSKRPQTVPQVIEGSSTGYMLITFPDCLPGVESTGDTKDPSETGHSAGKTEYCTLNSLKDGMLGKIRIHRSGKATLLLGDTNFLLDLGSRQSFRQDLVAVKLDESNSELVNLGQVTSTLMCSPDWESMLANL